MSNVNLAVIMDPIESIKPGKDSTLALLLEAQRRDWMIHYGTLNDIWLDDSQAFGRLSRLRVADDAAKWFEKDEATVAPLDDMDVILMRKDPPFDIEYIVATYVLERAQYSGVVVVNDPQGLRDANEKAFLAWFPNCAPPTLISRSLNDMRAFISEHRKVAVKPLHLMGGQSVFVTSVEDGNQNVILESITDRGRRYAMVQKYLPEIVESGDKRIILIDGHPVPMALARIPVLGDHRGNIVTGARIETTPLTDRDIWICNQIGPVLRDKGLLFAGIDVIGDFMTEINVTSPTGIRELEKAGNFQITQQLFDAISSKLA